ncbi:MAG: alpha/beta hydrolase family protein [Deinococcales bacterium]
MFDPISQDPHFELLHPPSNQSVRIGEMNALLHHAGASHRRPAVLLLHGFPGWERNFDLAHVYRRAGFHALVVHYRGAWGSSGVFSFQNALEDAHCALEWLRQHQDVDPNKTALVGHSMGGWIALATAATALCPTVAIAPANFGKYAQDLNTPQARAAWVTWCKNTIAPLNADAETLTDELLAHQEQWNLETLAPQLRVPLLFFGAERDAIASCTIDFAQKPLLERLPQKPNVVNLPTDHGFSSHRIALAKASLVFLQKHLETFL